MKCMAHPNADGPGVCASCVGERLAAFSHADSESTGDSPTPTLTGNEDGEFRDVPRQSRLCSGNLQPLDDVNYSLLSTIFGNRKSKRNPDPVACKRDLHVTNPRRWLRRFYSIPNRQPLRQTLGLKSDSSSDSEELTRPGLDHDNSYVAEDLPGRMRQTTDRGLSPARNSDSDNGADVEPQLPRQQFTCHPSPFDRQKKLRRFFSTPQRRRCVPETNGNTWNSKNIFWGKKKKIAESGESTGNSLSSSPMRLLQQGERRRDCRGADVVSGFAMCLSPLVRPSPQRGPALKAGSINRSRKFAGFTRLFLF